MTLREPERDHEGVLEFELGSVRVFATDRWDGGASTGSYASLNLADHVGDDPAAVHENRRQLVVELAAKGAVVTPDPRDWVWLRQVHGVRVVADPPRGTVPEADAAVTTERGRPLVVLTADCAPIALAADGAVAVVHAGWAGLAAGVIERAVASLRTVAGGPVRSLLGPCVRPARYEFGADLLARLVARFGADVAGSTDDGRPALDIPAAVGVALTRAGVDAQGDVGVCTASNDAYFSHRRDGVTGRQAVVAVLQ